VTWKESFLKELFLVIHLFICARVLCRGRVFFVVTLESKWKSCCLKAYSKKTPINVKVQIEKNWFNVAGNSNFLSKSKIRFHATFRGSASQQHTYHFFKSRSSDTLPLKYCSKRGAANLSFSILQALSLITVFISLRLE